MDTRWAENDPVHEALRKAVCIPEKAYLWTPADMVEFTPALSSTVYGDGRALIGLTTINSRPRYYVIRIDSRIEVGSDMNAPDGAPELWDIIDDIAIDLEEEFGCGDPTNLGEWCDERGWVDQETGEPLPEPEWPEFDDRDGKSWWRMDWPSLPNLEFAPHPYTRMGNLLAEKEPEIA